MLATERKKSTPSCPVFAPGVFRAPLMSPHDYQNSANTAHEKIMRIRRHARVFHSVRTGANRARFRALSAPPPPLAPWLPAPRLSRLGRAAAPEPHHHPLPAVRQNVENAQKERKRRDPRVRVGQHVPSLARHRIGAEKERVEEKHGHHQQRDREFRRPESHTVALAHPSDTSDRSDPSDPSERIISPPPAPVKPQAPGRGFSPCPDVQGQALADP